MKGMGIDDGTGLFGWDVGGMWRGVEEILHLVRKVGGEFVNRES